MTGPHPIRALVQLFSRPACGALLLSTALAPIATGCASPSKANIELRKQSATLEKKITQLERQHEADLASIRGLQEHTGVLPTLSQDRLNKLFTVGSMKLSKLTGGFNLDHEPGPDNGVRAYVQLFDTTGDLIKAAGAFKIEVFDLADPSRPLVASRSFPVEQADSLWYPMPLVYSFVLPVRWKTPPKHDDLLVKVTYTDELTQRVLTAEYRVHVNLGRPTTGPTSGPAKT